MTIWKIIKLRAGDRIELRPCYLIAGRQSRGAPVPATVLRWNFPWLVVQYGEGLRGRLSIKQLLDE